MHAVASDYNVRSLLVIAWASGHDQGVVEAGLLSRGLVWNLLQILVHTYVLQLNLAVLVLPRLLQLYGTAYSTYSTAFIYRRCDFTSTHRPRHVRVAMRACRIS